EAERPASVLSAGNHMHVAAWLAHALAGRRADTLALKLTNPVSRPDGSAVENAGRRIFYRSAFNSAARVLTITQAARDELAAAYPNMTGKLHVVHNPYITEAMLEVGATPHPFEPGRLLAIGR